MTNFNGAASLGEASARRKNEYFLKTHAGGMMACRKVSACFEYEVSAGDCTNTGELKDSFRKK